VIVPVTDASKLTVPLAGVSVMAWRSEPAPESAVFVTVTADAGAAASSPMNAAHSSAAK
jgi:hypothetical protein